MILYMLVKGGGKKRNSKKMGFEPVEDMIKSVGTEFSMLTADSLFGFMVIMEVPPDKFEYFGLSSTNQSMTRKITTYLLKLAVISQRPFHYLQPSIRIPGGSPPFCKASETPVNLYREAKLQQRVWLDSIVGGRIPVCPDVYAFSLDAGDSIFGGAHSRSSSYKRQSETNFEECYDFLHAKSHGHGGRPDDDYTIGAIAMEYIPNSRVLHDILHEVDNMEYKTAVCISAGAQVLRLFLNHSILHLDLHAGNILANDEGMAFIIDFGMVLDITKLTRNDVFGLRLEFGDDMETMQAQFMSKAYDIQHESTASKVEWCKGMFTFFRRVEERLNGRFQMHSLNTNLLDYSLHKAVFDKYMELTISGSTRLSSTFIGKKVEDGIIEIIDDPILDEMINFEPPPSYPTIAGTRDTVSGHFFDTPVTANVGTANVGTDVGTVVGTANVDVRESFENAIGIHKRRNPTKTNGRRKKRPNQTKRKIK